MPERPRPTAARAGFVPAGPSVSDTGPAPPPGTGRPASLFLAGVAPGRLCALWSVPEPAWRRAAARAPQGRAALRLYRLDTRDPVPAGTVIFIDSPEALRTLDVREGVFVAEVGMLHRDGRMDRLAASGPATVPAAGESCDTSLAILDVRDPPPPSRPHPLTASRFLRLFVRGRHPQPVVHRSHGRADAVHAAPLAPSTADVPATTPALAPAPSGGHAADPLSGWPLLLRGGRPAAGDRA